eukprot:COSAG03_NODE_1216_length_4541_cov_2.260693_1_plen_575_part_10
MSFWQADTKLAIGQKSVAIPADVQGEYDENKKITIKVDPSTEFFQPTESHLQFRIKLKMNSTDHAMRLQLNPDIGGHSLLRDVRIMSGTGVVLEECIAYNVMVQQMYSYDSNDNVRRKRALTEGTTLPQPLNRSTSGLDRRNDNATVDNPYFANDGTTRYNSNAAALVAFNDDAFQYFKICLPLKGSGIFRNPKIFPLMLTQGLRIEISLEEARKCINQLVQPSQFSYAPKLANYAKPQGGTLSAVGTTLTAGTAAAGAAAAVPARLTLQPGTTKTNSAKWVSGTSITFTGIAAGGGGSGWDDFNDEVYFVQPTATAGQFDLYDDAAMGAGNAVVVATVGTVNLSSASVAVNNYTLDTFTLAATNSMKSAKQCPFVVNQSLVLRSDQTTAYADGSLSGGKLSGKVASIDDTGGTVKIKMSVPTRFTAGITGAPAVMCNTPDVMEAESPGSFNPQYVLDQVELVLQKIVMPAGYVSTMMKSMKEAGMIRYDFNAMQTYKYSMTQYDREGTIMLPLQNSRAKAMLCCPINATSYAASGAIDQTVGYGFRGIADNITEYRFTYNGKLNPDRPVPLAKV